ncbi:hypothetical protein BDV95DRAFT_591467 [Massariosphaeria phaeospora]|uniref:DUF2293 domain-containing protein n=1 Tax=Massariosphaeria phaeospora TaxID=100035 RepID=A0A7C8MQK4_9PLEO|nr:hypothetical protein BDV95DRAFT_591467 [Massariosphaeria phaeospora]
MTAVSFDWAFWTRSEDPTAKNTSESTPSEDATSEGVTSEGEEMRFETRYPPKGFTFLPAGYPYITRRSRELSEKVYAVWRNKGRKKPSTQVGFYVPEDALREATAEFEAKREKVDEELWQALNKKYPKIPDADKDRLRTIVRFRSPQYIGKPSDESAKVDILKYVRDRYTHYKVLPHPLSASSMDRVRQKTESILTSWRGENSEEEESSKSRHGTMSEALQPDLQRNVHAPHEDLERTKRED